MLRVLLVEDEVGLGEQVEKVLSAERYSVRWVLNLQDARAAIESEAPEVALVDLNLPDGDGLDLLSVLRKLAPDSRNIVLTARTDPQERIKGLDLGADDYLGKPFVLAELLARIRAQSRRLDEVVDRELTFGPLVVQLTGRQARLDGHLLSLAPREMDMLLLLAQQSPSPVSRDTLARLIWETSNRTAVVDNIIDVHIARLRKKIELPDTPRLLHTVRGVGFSLELKS